MKEHYEIAEDLLEKSRYVSKDRKSEILLESIAHSLIALASAQMPEYIEVGKASLYKVIKDLYLHSLYEKKEDF